MEFTCGTGFVRPIRLSESTREFAWRSLHGYYGDEADKVPCISMDDVECLEQMKKVDLYDLCIRAIAEKAPVRIIPEERLCGAAVLGDAIRHLVPARYNNDIIFGSVSHLTIRFQNVLELGMDGIEQKILREGKEPLKHHLLHVIESMRIWHRRYLEAERIANPSIAAVLEKVPFGVPETFYEAVQSIWFTFAFVRLCGNWPGIGRIDEMLEPFLQKDLREGRITLEEAREILAHFFIKGCEWIESNTALGTGDAQHYQNIILSGTDINGNDITGEVTYLILDVVEELPIGDFPITVRLHEKTPPKLLKRIAEIIRYGSGVIAVYNEPLILRALDSVGYSPEEAIQFANDGCWEVQVPGKTNFGYYPFDSYSILMKEVLGIGGTHQVYPDYESLYDAFMDKIRENLDAKYIRICDSMFDKDENGNWTDWKPGGPQQIRASYEKDCIEIDRNNPSHVIALFEDGCMESGRDYNEGGPRYVVRAPHIGGAPDAGNSLYAIRKVVFEEKLLTFPDFLDILEKDWEGEEVLRQNILNKYSYYGNDNPEVDAIIASILNDFADIVLAHQGETKLIYIPGVSTFGRQIDWLPQRSASPFGMKKGTILSGNCSPTPGTDAEGATAIIKSYCSANLEKQVNGAALDIKLHPSAVRGENGLAAIEALLTGFMELGGYFMQIDVIDSTVLEEARKNPEAYKTLSVRVSGWNARFVTLSKPWQDMIIERTATGI